MSSGPSACERLARSRECLQQALRDVGSGPKAGSAERPGPLDPCATEWLTQLKTLPGANLLAMLMGDWWARQPLRVAMSVVAETAKAALKPMAQSHPFRLVTIAAVAGAALVVLRPWRLISMSALLGGLLPKMVAQVLRIPPEQVRPKPSQ